MIYDDEFMADNAGIVALPIFAIVTVLDGVYCRWWTVAESLQFVVSGRIL